LRKGVTKVVSWISRYDENFAACLGELNGETTRGSCLANATLSTDKDPLKALLLNNVSQGGRHRLLLDFHIQNCCHPLASNSVAEL